MKQLVVMLTLSVTRCVAESPANGPAFADTVLLSGNILTLDAANRTTAAIAIRSGRVLAVGDDAPIKKQVGPITRVVQLDGATDTPGIIAAHIRQKASHPANGSCEAEGFGRDEDVASQPHDTPEVLRPSS